MLENKYVLQININVKKIFDINSRRKNFEKVS